MDHAFWHQRWQQQQIGFHRDAFHDLLISYFPKVCRSGRVFVPLCGKSNDMLWLLDQGYRVFGVELNPLAVEAFFAENQLKPSIQKRGKFTEYRVDELVIWLGDVFALTATDLADVDAWYDRASLVALPEGMRKDYIELLNHTLPAGCTGLLVTVEYPAGYWKGPPFSIAETEVRDAFAHSFKVERMARVEGFMRNNELLEDSPVTEQAYLLYR